MVKYLYNKSTNYSAFYDRSHPAQASKYNDLWGEKT